VQEFTEQIMVLKNVKLINCFMILLLLPVSASKIEQPTFQSFKIYTKTGLNISGLVTVHISTFEEISADFNQGYERTILYDS
jgi:hypothetical protein